MHDATCIPPGEGEVLGILKDALVTTLDGEVPEEGVSRDSPLQGPSGLLDSYEMMLFLVNVDSRLVERYGVEMVVDRVLADGTSPTATMGSMVDYVMKLLQRPAGT